MVSRACFMAGLLALSLAGCGGGAKTIVEPTRKIDGPREVAVAGPRYPWVTEIENRLRAQGFRTLRFASQRRVTEQVTPDRLESYDAGSTRYVLYTNGEWAGQCFAGGYRFSFLTAELVDLRENETLLSVSGSGYSENCDPVSGTLYADIVDAVVKAWR